MNSATAIRIAAVSGFLVVALGAMGAHLLEETLEAREATGTWQTAVQYHLFHTLVLLFLARYHPVRPGPFAMFLAGMVIFCGTLYLLALTGTAAFGLLTPAGGVTLLAAWIWLAADPPRARQQQGYTPIVPR